MKFKKKLLIKFKKILHTTALYLASYFKNKKIIELLKSYKGNDNQIKNILYNILGVFSLKNIKRVFEMFKRKIINIFDKL